MILYENNRPKSHCMKSVRIRSFSDPHFSAFGLNTEIHRVNLSIQSKCGKMRTTKTLNVDTFLAVLDNAMRHIKNVRYFSLHTELAVK